MLLRLYAGAMRRHWFLLTACAVLGGAALGFWGWRQPYEYQVTTRLVAAFGTEPVDIPIAAAAADSLHVPQRLIELRVRAYSQKVETVQVTAPVRNILKLHRTPHLAAASPLDSTFIDITATDTSRQRAIDTVKTAAAVLGDIARHEVHTEEPVSFVRLTPVGPLDVTRNGDLTRRQLPLATGVLGGFMIGVGAATLRAQLATRRRPAFRLHRKPKHVR
jgi:hypothetical protein